MLRNLEIQNIAVIERLSCELESGMTVLTGETGAGKSMIIDAVNMILGGRASKLLVRYGTEKALVQAVFSVSEAVCGQLAELGIPVEDQEVFISREMTADGRSTARINGIMVPQNILRQISTALINIHGQHDNQALLTPSCHVEFLDAFAGNKALLEEYSRLYQQMRELEKRIAELSMDEQARLARVDFLQYQTAELEKADLKIGEKEALIEQRDKIANSEKITQSVAKACHALYADSEHPAYDAVCHAVDAVSEIAGLDQSMQTALERLVDLKYTIEEVVHDLRAFGDGVEFDAQVLEDLEARIDVIRRMEKKYGGSTETAIRYLESAKEELEEIGDSTAKIAELSATLVEIEAQLTETAAKLTQARKTAAVALSEKIRTALWDLDLPKANFSVEILPAETFLANGKDTIEFLLASNPGEPPKPLAKIASGGELSRVMLAMKSVLSDLDNVDTLIFDEIDTGVSGSAAQKIAQKLSALGERKQVICISHQPQLAAAADHHFLILKSEQDGRSTTKITVLDEAAREQELARIIDGDHFTETAVIHAREMRENARRKS